MESAERTLQSFGQRAVTEGSHTPSTNAAARAASRAAPRPIPVSLGGLLLPSVLEVSLPVVSLPFTPALASLRRPERSHRTPALGLQALVRAPGPVRPLVGSTLPTEPSVNRDLQLVIWQTLSGASRGWTGSVCQEVQELGWSDV